ncbi:ABC transporter permease [Streptomyces albiflavescens]|uniref:ABC transporter permease n=1 Tax=Streptomyces albiflavescens TaxID=1623582 RepID=A0A917XW78_9ACTN|nr:ABC transporter permease [Streptomyces albiflavescens]GGN55873.1 ABC transporter permease [Streptomyces albiflavescens]
MTPTTPTVALAPPAPRFVDLLAAEWIKLRSLRSTYWALGTGALAVIAFNANAARVDASDFPRFDPRMRANMQWLALRDAFSDGSAMILILAVASIGAITVVGEYSTGLIRTTFTAVPDRRALMAAKVTLVTAVMTVYGALVAGASFALTQAILDTRDRGLPLSHPGALRVVVASALLAPVCALAGMALGALIRHSATTMVATTAVLLLIPTFITDRYRWTAAVKHAQPVNAWTRLTDIAFGHDPFTLVPRHPATVTGAWITFAAWAAVSAVVAVVAVDRRDV